MSRSEADRHTRFDSWIRQEFRKTGGFTALVILVTIGELSVTPLRSTYFHVIGDEVGWAEVAALLAGAGAAWDGAVFATLTDKDGGGPVEDVNARHELQELAERLMEDRLVLNDNHFFDRWGRRLRIDEVTVQ